MPRISRQDRHNYLLIPEDPSTVLEPHWQTQTFYTYPFTPFEVLMPLAITVIPILFHAVISNDTESRNSAARLVFLPLFILEQALFAVVHPWVAGHVAWRVFEAPTPTGGLEVETVYVVRPLFGRAKCEQRYGAAGGYPYDEYGFGLLERVLKVRRESAIWVVEW